MRLLRPHARPSELHISALAALVTSALATTTLATTATPILGPSSSSWSPNETIRFTSMADATYEEAVRINRRSADMLLHLVISPGRPYCRRPVEPPCLDDVVSSPDRSSGDDELNERNHERRLQQRNERYNQGKGFKQRWRARAEAVERQRVAAAAAAAAAVAAAEAAEATEDEADEAEVEEEAKAWAEAEASIPLLRALIALRSTLARGGLTYRVATNAVLIGIAQARPRSNGELLMVRVPAYSVQSFGRDWLRCVAEAEEAGLGESRYGRAGIDRLQREREAADTQQRQRQAAVAEAAVAAVATVVAAAPAAAAEPMLGLRRQQVTFNPTPEVRCFLVEEQEPEAAGAGSEAVVEVEEEEGVGVELEAEAEREGGRAQMREPVALTAEALEMAGDAGSDDDGTSSVSTARAGRGESKKKRGGKKKSKDERRALAQFKGGEG